MTSATTRSVVVIRLVADQPQVIGRRIVELGESFGSLKVHR